MVIKIKNLIALSIILGVIYLGFKESIVKNIFYKEITEELIFLVIILSSVFNLILIRLHIGDFIIEIGILSIILIIFLYIFFIMYKKRYIEINNEREISVLLISLSLINVYLFLEPIFIYIYYPESYSLYLLIYFNVELLLLVFLFLRRFKYRNRTIINVVAVFSLMNGILGLLQYVTGRFLINFKDPAQKLTELYLGSRISGFVMGDNGGGNLGVIILPILLYKYKENKNIFNFVLISGDILFTIFTFTRIAYLAMGVEFIIFFIGNFKQSSVKDILKKISMIFITLCLGIYCYLNYLQEIMNIFFLERGDTQNERFVQFYISIKAFLSTPIIGTGHGQYNSYIFDKFGTIDDLQIHSQLLNLLVEEGILIFMFFIIFNIFLILFLFKKYRKKKEEIFIIMIFVGNLICSNFNTNQTYEINNSIYYLILFGLLFSTEERLEEVNTC